jgi:MATE family, multidrug efflux pump
VRFPLAWMLMDRWQADAIWWSFPISSVVAVVMAGLYYKYGHWRELRIAPGVPAMLPAAAPAATSSVD